MGAPPLSSMVWSATCLEQKPGPSLRPICHCEHPNYRHLLSSRLWRRSPHPVLVPRLLLRSRGAGGWPVGFPCTPHGCSGPSELLASRLDPRGSSVPVVSTPSRGTGCQACSASPLLSIGLWAPGSSGGACAQSFGGRGAEGRGAVRPQLNRCTPRSPRFPTLGRQQVAVGSLAGAAPALTLPSDCGLQGLQGVTERVPSRPTTLQARSCPNPALAAATTR